VYKGTLGKNQFIGTANNAPSINVTSTQNTDYYTKTTQLTTKCRTHHKYFLHMLNLIPYIKNHGMTEHKA